MYEPPQDFDEWLAAFEADDNEWWRTSSGQHLNLFEEAVDRWRACMETVRDKERVIAELYQKIEVLTQR